MGKKKYIHDIEDLFRKSPVVNFSSIEMRVKNKQYTKQLIRNLILKKKIKRITKGFYTLHDDPSLTVFCFRPAYLGLQDALSIHNLWEQETIPIIVTTRRVRQGVRSIFGTNVLIRRINKNYFFGFEYIKQGDFYLPVSDIEKTLIDMVYFKQKLSEEAIENIIKKINKKKLDTYLKKYPRRFRKMVLKAIEKQ